MDFNCRKGQAAVAIAIVGFAVVVVIGMFLLAQIQQTFNTTELLGCFGDAANSSAQANKTCTQINDTFDTGYDALQLLAVGIIVLAASAIIAIVAGIGR